MRSLILILTFLAVSLNAFAGIKCTRSSTNPSTYVDADGKRQLLILSNVVRPKNYYDATGFHALGGWMVEPASTNYMSNSFFSLDANSDGLADGWSKSYGTVTLETCSISNITGAKSQKNVYTYTGSEVSWCSLLSYTTTNDSIDCSGGTVAVTFACDIKGDLSAFSTTTKITFLNVDELNNANVLQRSCFASAITNAATYITSSWKRMIFTFNCTDTDTRKLRFYFFQKADLAGTPASGQIVNFEISHIQIEKSATMTSFIPTTTAALTRNAESLKCRKFLD